MPHLIITENAEEGVIRCIRFLLKKSIPAAKRAAKEINQSLNVLITTPDIGRPSPNHHGRRELTIEFGDSGYVALYRVDEIANAVYVLAFRHQKEAGY
jgi:plasmid stabilization system protein ParE